MESGCSRPEITTEIIEAIEPIRTLSVLDLKPHPFTVAGLELTMWNGHIIPKAMSLLFVGKVWCKSSANAAMRLAVVKQYIDLYNQFGTQLKMIKPATNDEDLGASEATVVWTLIAHKIGVRTHRDNEPSPALAALANAVPASEVLGLHLRHNMLQI